MKEKPMFRSVPTFRDFNDYHDAEQYTKGWNEAMRYIFAEELEEQERKQERAEQKERLKHGRILPVDIR